MKGPLASLGEGGIRKQPYIQSTRGAFEYSQRDLSTGFNKASYFFLTLLEERRNVLLGDAELSESGWVPEEFCKVE
jgi:hypothetical protein